MTVLPLDIQLLRTLRRGAKRMTEEAQACARAFVQSQMLSDGSFKNRGGKSDLYYTMFGWMMCYTLGIKTEDGQRKAYLDGLQMERLDALHQTVYHQCLLLDELLHHGLLRATLRNWHERHHLEAFMHEFVMHTVTQTLNGTAASLFDREQDWTEREKKLQYILSLQDPTGGFLANEGAAMPDLLTTAVALFTLKANGVAPAYETRDFVEVHFHEDGSFMSNLIDEQSDVEYSFYGLLALGSEGK